MGRCGRCWTRGQRAYHSGVTRLIVALVIVVIVGAAGWYFEWRYVARPSYSCSLADANRCADTEHDATWFDLDGRPLAIDIRPPPQEWATSPDPELRAAPWAARIDRFLQEPVLAACYYSSPPEVSCQVQSSD